MHYRFVITVRFGKLGVFQAVQENWFEVLALMQKSPKDLLANNETNLCQSISSFPRSCQTQAARQRSVAFRWDRTRRPISGGSWLRSGNCLATMSCRLNRPISSSSSCTLFSTWPIGSAIKHQHHTLSPTDLTVWHLQQNSIQINHSANRSPRNAQDQCQPLVLT